MDLPGPAIGLLELESIAKGLVATDALVKRAKVSISVAEPITPGKFVLLFSGPVAEVEESLRAGKEIAASGLLDELYLPQASLGLLAALKGTYEKKSGESVGIVETHSVASAAKAADTALKAAEVWLTHLHLALSIGGKGYFCLTGALHMVESALSAAAESIAPELLVTTELIQSPHVEARAQLLSPAHRLNKR